MARDTSSGGGLPICQIWKAHLERQKSYIPDTICYGHRNQFDLEVKGHQQWYATHRLEVVYLHAKYAKPVLNDKKVTALTRFVTDARTNGQTDHYRRPPQSGGALIIYTWPTFSSLKPDLFSDVSSDIESSSSYVNNKILNVYIASTS